MSNYKFKTTNIRGKQYVEVNEHQVLPSGRGVQKLDSIDRVHGIRFRHVCL